MLFTDGEIQIPETNIKRSVLLKYDTALLYELSRRLQTTNVTKRREPIIS
jgi:hypothetical protein